MDYPKNPDYGNGRFRRAILMRHTEPGRVEAQLEDTCHGFAVRLDHDGERVTGIDGTALRFPLSTCVDAPRQLAPLVGFPLNGRLADWFKVGNPGGQCTHLFDLATLAFSHASRDDVERRYDIVIEDADADGILDMMALCNGELKLHWKMDSRDTLTSPADLAGKPMMRGFHQWASVMFFGDDLEIASQMQRGGFVCSARRYDANARAGRRAADHGMPRGTCYSYSEPAVQHAIGLAGATRDFSECPEQLLKFR